MYSPIALLVSAERAADELAYTHEQNKKTEVILYLLNDSCTFPIWQTYFIHIWTFLNDLKTFLKQKKPTFVNTI